MLLLRELKLNLMFYFLGISVWIMLIVLAVWYIGVGICKIMGLWGFPKHYPNNNKPNKIDFASQLNKNKHYL